MPAKSYRRDRCQWTEAGRRCQRDAADERGLCKPHLIAAAEANRAASSAAARAPSGGPISDLIEDFFAGTPFGDRVSEALNDAAYKIGGIFGGGYSPPIDTEPPPYVPPRQREAHRYHQHHEQRQAPPPPRAPASDPRVQQARTELGIAPSAVVGVEDVNALRKKLARKYHPDIAGPDERRRKQLQERMMRINGAADVLIESLERTAERA